MIDLGTWLYTKFRGQHVGTDQLGNRYYRRKKASNRVATLMRERRWVIYKGDNEASKVPAEWHGWLHHTVKELPDEQSMQRYDWQIDHEPNHTGTSLAYRPPGSVASSDKSGEASDYQSWSPS
jgi:NADH:ubiquinone oxidoreductase subunit